jgi:alkylated DNA repair dioxygenase AlkB
MIQKLPFVDAPLSLLSKDGDVLYWENFLQKSDSQTFIDELQQKVSWKPDEVIMFGKKIITKREMAWYGNEGMEYRYSGITRKPLIWIAPLLEIKKRVEAKTGAEFNSCLLNLYHDGSESMGWHSDDEPELGPEPIIASVSLGAERKFSFKHRKTGETVSLILANGSLLLMQGKTQAAWVHALAKSTRVKEPRINLTFRRILAPAR